ncbi:MAG: ArnT family glycosyltransferase [Blastocatellales bacterium]
MQSEISRPINGSASAAAEESVQNSLTDNLLRFLSWALAIGCFVWAAKDQRFRNAEGFLRGEFCFPFTTGIALSILGYSIPKPWKVASAWLTMALIGQAATLQMIDAGPTMHYQHYRPLHMLIHTSPWLLVLFAIQTFLVLIGLRRSWSNIRSWLIRNFKVWQLLAIGLAFILTSATVSREITFYLQELPFAALVQIISLINLLLAAKAIPDGVLAGWKSNIERWTGWGADESAGFDRIVIVAAIGVTALSAFLSVFSYQRHPHIGDEVCYLYHARYLAAGVLTMPLPPALDAFNLDLFDYDATRWYASPPQGWPLVLAIGVWFKAPWLVNPLLSGLCIVLTYLLIRELYDRRTGRLSALLLALSPWYALVGMSFMTHTAALAFSLTAALSVVWVRKTGRIHWALLAGLATGMVGMIRPLEGAIIGGLLGLWMIGIGGKRLKVSAIAAWIFGCLIVGLIIFQYNKTLTGNPTRFPIMAWADRFMGVNSNAMGFGPDRGNGWALDPYPGHSPFDAIINSNLNITAINTELFGWGIGSLLLMALLVFSLKLRNSDYLMLALIAAVFTAHFFYWFSGGPDFAARYWFLMIVPCVVLSVRGLQFLANKLTGDVDRKPLNKTRLLAIVLSLCAMAMVNFTLWRAIDKYHHYLGMRPDVRYLAESQHFGKSLILIRGRHYPDFASAATYNPIDLRADAPVYAWDSSASLRAKLLEQYADRPIWIVEGPSLTGTGFKIVEGPLTAQILLERDRKSAESNHWQPPYAEKLPADFGPAYTKGRAQEMK